MQNKGLIKVFAILFGLVCIYQLSFTYITNNVESEAEEFAAEKIDASVENYSDLRDQAEQKYLDSIGNKDIIAGIQMVSSASNTCLRSRSAVECTATVLIPSSLQARNIRSAISPRFAMTTLSNIRVGLLGCAIIQ